MLKFDIIAMPHHKIKNKDINFITQKMNLPQEKDTFTKKANRGVFIATNKNEKGIVGGAYLLEKKYKDIQEEVREFIPTSNSYPIFIWECSHIYFEVSSEHSVSATTEFDFFTRKFYQKLYETLVEFGKKNGINFIIINLPIDQYIRTIKYGSWPYIVKLNSAGPADILFHGILPLTGSPLQAYLKTLSE